MRIDSQSTNSNHQSSPDKAEGLTVESLRSFPGCQALSDNEAIQIVDSLCRLSQIIIDNSMVQKPLGIVVEMYHHKKQAA
jgi:hypothetical protein